MYYIFIFSLLIFLWHICCLQHAHDYHAPASALTARHKHTHKHAHRADPARTPQPSSWEFYLRIWQRVCPTHGFLISIVHWELIYFIFVLFRCWTMFHTFPWVSHNEMFNINITDIIVRNIVQCQVFKTRLIWKKISFFNKLFCLCFLITKVPGVHFYLKPN